MKKNWIDSVFTRKPHLWQSVLFLLVCLLIGFLQIGNYQGRLGYVHADDWPPAYSYLFAYPERFSNDIIATYGPQQTFSTLQNLLPALMYRYLSVPPEIPTLLLILAQYILVGLSMRRFAKIITGSETASWMAALLVLGANTFEWNLANFGSVMFSPYAGHLVMAFILYAFSDVLEEKNLRAMIWLFIGALIHPTMVLYATGMIGIYWLLQRRWKGNKLAWISLVLVALSAIVPRLIIQSVFNQGDLLSFEEMETAMLNNQHMTPVNLNIRTQSFLMFLPLIFLALRERTRLSQKYLRVWLSVVLGCALLVVLLWVGWEYKILAAVQLIPHRSSILLVFISLPLVIGYLYRNFNEGSPLVVWFSILLLSLLMWLNTIFLYDPDYHPIYLALLLVLLVSDVLSGGLGPFRWKRTQVSSMGSEQIAPFDIKWLKRKGHELAVILSLAALIGIAILNSWEIGLTSRSSQARDMYDLQVWVRDNTPEDAVIIDLGRTVSQRASISFYPKAWYIYNRSRSALEYEQCYYSFYEPFFDNHNFTLEDMSNLVLNEEDIMRFANLFGANYIVQSRSNELEFQKLFWNGHFILYSIPSVDNIGK